MSVILLYHLLAVIFFPFYIIILLARTLKGKENINSLKSRFAIYNQKRKKEKLIWVHAASVGESIIAINLVNQLRNKYGNADFLITTGTLSSANLINQWLPIGVYHEFTPLDNIFIIRRFYKYWQPTLGIFVEFDIWPVLVTFGAKKCKLILLNGRLSDKSFRSWQKFPKIFKMLTDSFSYIGVQSTTDLEKYQLLGCVKAENLGNIKFTNKELKVDKKELTSLQTLFKGRKIFVAASTHEEDESVLLDVICQFKKEKIDKFFPIIVLRHPERASEVGAIFNKLGLRYTLRSDKTKNNILKNDLYIVNSFGELGLFYSLADITFIGGSFKMKSRIAGHNLLEPAHFGNVIIVGPNMSNFRDITDEMLESKACIQVNSSEELKNQILYFLADKNQKVCQKYSANAKKYVESKQKILTNYLQQIDIFFND